MFLKGVSIRYVQIDRNAVCLDDPSVRVAGWDSFADNKPFGVVSDLTLLGGLSFGHS